MTPRKPKRAKQLGITDADYARLLEHQDGHCALCPNVPKRLKKDGTPYRLHVDHDHATDRVRGLLCWRCNDALPTWVTAAWLRRAADYLEPPPQRRSALPDDLVTKPLLSIGGVGGQAAAYREAMKTAARGASGLPPESAV